MALSLLPTAALADGETGTTGPTIKTSEELVAAIKDAPDGATITLGKGTFTTYGNESPKKSLTFVGSGTDTVWTIGNLGSTTGGEGNGDYSFDGCDTITFKNMTLKSDSADYRGFIRINNTVVDNCTIDGKTAYWGYNTAKFQNGTIFKAPKDDYALWDYSSKSMTFDNCTFNISGKGVNVYVEAGNAGSDARTVKVKDCTVNSTEKNKAFLNIKNSTQAYEVEITGNNKVTGLSPDTTTGSDLYQVEITTITETSGKPVKIQERAADGTLTTVYEVKAPAVAEVGGTGYTTLDDALEALDGTNHTLTLLDENAWTYKDVYWSAGSQVGSEDTLKAAMEAAYAKNAESITIICKPNATIKTSPAHINVTGDITVYANGADFGGNDLSIGTYVAPETSETTINIYDARNLVVWGQPVGDRADVWNVNFIDCVNDGNNFLMYRGGETGIAKINATLTGCKATGFNDSIIHTTADGSIAIKNCGFANNCAPVNIAHKQTGTMTVTVENSTFTNCGSTNETNDLNQYAAPVRIVNNNETGTVATAVTNCTFAGTVGNNGDILIGDGRTGKTSNDVALTVSGTAANVQAQKPGYYNGESTDVAKMMAKQVAKNESLETSVNKLLPNAAKIGDNEYATLKEALESLKSTNKENVTIELLADQNVAGFTVDLSNSAINTLTIQGNGKKLDSLVNGVGIDGPIRCPVINAQLPADATFSVDGIVAPNSLLFDTGSEASLVVKNSTFNESQTGYPAAKNITYQGNTFEFKGDASEYYTNNAFPIWYKIENKTENTTRSIAFLNNKVTGPRGFHIETRSTDADKQVNIKANGNTFNLSDSSEYKNKTIALQLVANLNGEIEFKDNQVNAYMGVCFYKDIVAQDVSKLTIKNNYTSGKLYGSSEWNADGSTTQEQIAAADKFAREIVEGRESANNGSAITEGHTHNYVNDKCTICGQTAPGGGSSDPIYSVSTPSKTENGTVTVSPKSASKGDTVTITVDPDEGYVLDELTVTDSKGEKVELTKVSDTKYTFTMPRSRVTIEATFVEDPDYVEPDPSTSVADIFDDIQPGAWYEDAVQFAYDEGIMTGTSKTTFEPNTTTTRGMIVSILHRLEGNPVVTEEAFSDVSADDWYGKAVAWASSEGIVGGYGDGTFQPNKAITREEMASILYRYAQYKDQDVSARADLTKYTDADQVGAWAEEVMQWANAEGLINGMTEDTLVPQGNATRAQVAAMFQRYLNK